jgi:archaellum component FlaC
VVAPAVAAHFPDTYKNLNGWLKHAGVSAVFDVSFGAELTVHSYVQHIKKNAPATVIAQPCPALVSYIQIYQPDLLPHLAPAHSPMLHTMAMIREYYPDFINARIAVISPCIAKKREFEETALGDYNVTFTSLQKHFTDTNTSLTAYPAVEFDSTAAERAVLFSTPGGLMETAERDVPGIRNKTRKIEGPHSVYDYLSTLSQDIKNRTAPLVVDCLNCEQGCNGGTGTDTKDLTLDQIEGRISRRREEMQKKYGKPLLGKHKLRRAIKKHWKDDLYTRTYENLSKKNTLTYPTEDEKQAIHIQAKKETPNDLLNCRACGYHSCDDMAVAIYNGLNKAENCVVYREKVLEEREKDKIDAHTYKQQQEELSQTLEKNRAVSESLYANIKKIEAHNQEISGEMNNLLRDAQTQLKTLQDLTEQVSSADTTIGNFKKIVTSVKDIAFQTKMLSLNASIESARAGEYGRGFATVAGEVGRLAAKSRHHAEKIEPQNKALSDLFDNLRRDILASADMMAHTMAFTEKITARAEEVSAAGRSLEEESQKLLSENRISNF